MQGQLQLTCLFEAPVTECSTNGTLNNARHVTDIFLAPSPSSLPSITVTVTSATNPSGDPVPLLDGLLPPTRLRGGSCDNILRSARSTVLMDDTGQVQGVTVAVTLANTTVDLNGIVAVHQSFAVAFRTIGSAVRPLCFSDTQLLCWHIC
jgi:hypothetical protein